MDFSLLYFANRRAVDAPAEYDLLTRSARFADEHGFTALWIPERHFHQFGGGYPNPALAAAALANVTTRIRLRAGSVVVPLHDPLRIVEDWSFVDNLSGGRVDLALASGWNTNDFVLAPDRYAERRRHTLDTVVSIREMWAGKPVFRDNGVGESVAIVTYPRPLQSELELWLTCTASSASFEAAGAAGLNVLTALLFQDLNELARNIRRYRAAAARAGHDPAGARVTAMVHAHAGETDGRVRDTVRDAFLDYLASSLDLWKGQWPEVARFDRELDRARLLGYAFERYYRTATLFGSVAKCVEFARRLASIGVDEVAALIDFGLDSAVTLDALPYLDEVRRAVQET